MSNKVMDCAWGHPLPPTARLVLVALASAADKDGVCWPSVRFLANRCSASERSISQNLDLLVKRGLVKKEERFRQDGSQTSNRYIVLLHPAAPSAKPAPTHEGVSSPPPQDLHPPPAEKGGPMNPHSEPKGNTTPTPGVVVDLVQLVFPACIAESQRPDAASSLRQLSNEDAQVVLDELDGCAQASEVKKPMAYLRALIARALTGEFKPELALSVKEKREARERHLQTMKRNQLQQPRTRPPTDAELTPMPPRIREQLRSIRDRANAADPPGLPIDSRS